MRRVDTRGGDDDLDERELLLQALMQDGEFIRQQARRFAPCPDEVGDVEQRIWLAALHRPPASAFSLRPWIVSVARRIGVDAWRVRATREHRKVPFSDDRVQAAETASGTGEGQKCHASLVARVFELIELLPWETQQFLHLRYTEGRSFREIGALTGVGAVTARTRHHRALVKLRRLLVAYPANDRSLRR